MKSVAHLRLLPVVFVAFAAACDSPTGEPYKAQAAWSGRKANVPAAPTLSTAPIKAGASYTVFGATHHLQSLVHGKEVTGGKELVIEGYIVESNLPDAPACALHPTGKKDPDDCKSDIPSFWIADAKDAPAGSRKIRVMGFAKNFASLFDANAKYKNLKEAPKELLQDDMWGVAIPFPLPAVGAKVRVTGTYDVGFTKASSGAVTDPVNGIVTFKSLETVEPGTAPFAFKNKK